MYIYHIFLALETVVIEIPIPINSEDDIIKLYSEVLNDDKDIKLAIVDHITSASAILMPVKRIAELCHMNGVMVLVDGAHAPGQIPLNMEDLGVDFYCGRLLCRIVHFPDRTTSERDV